jgi:hypothetical protein
MLPADEGDAFHVALLTDIGDWVDGDRERVRPTVDGTARAGPWTPSSPIVDGRPPVDLVAVAPPDRHSIEPFEVLEVPAGDLAERPAAEPAEVEDAARRPTRWRPLGAKALRHPHRVVEAAADGGSTRSPVA